MEHKRIGLGRVDSVTKRESKSLYVTIELPFVPPFLLKFGGSG